jgi:hypothetical protein
MDERRWMKGHEERKLIQTTETYPQSANFFYLLIAQIRLYQSFVLNHVMGIVINENTFDPELFADDEKRNVKERFLL